MHSLPRLVLVLLAALVAQVLVAAPDAAAAGGTPTDEPCVCVVAPGSGACQHFLRNPKKPTDDPCWCPRCRDGTAAQKHGGKTVPKGWNPVCFADKSEEAWLRRHALAFGIHCSDCIQGEAKCLGAPDPCPVCAWSGTSTKDWAGRNAKKTVLDRISKEERLFRDWKAVRLLYTRDFYLVTDVPQMRVATGPTTWRMVSGHEWAHLMIERAAYARREFHEALGDPLIVDKPTGMYIPVTRRDGNNLAGAYLGNPTANILYGGSDTSTVADAFCFHGFVISMEHFGDGGDPGIHFAMRHMIGHELISCWTVVDGHNRALPRWLHVGAAHWLSRLQPRFREDAFACNLEGQVLDLPGKDWDKDLRRIALGTKPGAIETLLAKNAQGQLTADDHRRAWSYVDLCLAEWRAPFVKLLQDLRRRVPARDAWVADLGVTPEVFDERWRERILGKRPSMDPQKKDDAAATAEKLGARERAALETEKDPATLAALVRGLGTITDAGTAETVADLLGRDQPLVRETALVSLLSIKDPAVFDAAWKHGLAASDGVERAYAARLCATRSIAAAAPQLRDQLADSNWYARAEAAYALGTLLDAESMTRLVKLLDDPSDKTQVAAMDALAMLGGGAEAAVEPVARHLSAAQWQIRLVAAQTLGSIGSMEGVEPLIGRMETESGRLRHDIQTALTKITRDDLGRRPENWRAWWERQKAANGGRIPGRPADPGAKPAPPPTDAGSTTAVPDYFGIELFCNRVGFVIDTSGSMLLSFVPSPEDRKRHGRTLSGTNKLEMCKSEIGASLLTLDPRSHFNVIAFSDDVDPWKKFPVPASKPNVEDATSWLRGQAPRGETNYYDALRTMLDVGDRLDAQPNFGDTPDTITFLTDGMPTKGDITDSKTLLSWYTNLNRYARVTTHVIAFGDKGIEVEFMRALAERNFGTFVHVHGKEQ